MLLNEYIAETLVQIVRGVKDASEQVRELGREVNRADASFGGKLESEQQNIKFDI